MRDGTSEKLGLWVCLPLLLWVLVWIAALSMPSADCDGSGTDAGSEEAVLVVVVAAASLSTAGAALLRLVRLGQAGAFSLRRDLAIGGIVAAALVVASTSVRAEVLLVVGLLLTGVALLALLVAWAVGLRANQVGMLLPLYLLGAAVIAYPLVGLIGLLSSSGIGC